MKITIKDIAKTAGVSVSTVSLVLNNRPGISEDTRTSVIETAKSLGYDLSSPANTKPTNDTIRFLQIARHGHMINKDHRVFIADYIEGIDRQAREKGYVVEVSNYANLDLSLIQDDLEKRPSAGIIVLATEFDDADIQSFNKINCPLVFIDTCLSYNQYDFVDMDNERAVYSVISTLKEYGHTKIGLVKSSSQAKNFFLREKSFYEALQFYGIEINKEYIYNVDSTLETSFNDMDRQLAEKRELPTAFFCVCDIISYGVMRALKKSGYNIPNDISIVGFDNLPQSTVTDPPLTSIKVSKVRIGERAFDTLLSRIIQKATLPFEKVLVGGELIIRDSLQRI